MALFKGGLYQYLKLIHKLNKITLDGALQGRFVSVFETHSQALKTIGITDPFGLTK